MTYQETIEYLYSRLPVFHRIGKAAYKADLSNTVALCEHLDNPQHKFKSVHVAGTNGKGSSSHMLAAILQSAGYKTGLYTSPHLKSFTERIRINGKEMPQEAVVEFVARNQAFVEKLQPSFFELTVGMAFEYFANEQVDIAIIEVGLGGRLDSTNVITPEVSLITNISWDHADILGDTLEKIAAEKAGIIKPNVPVVISERQPEIAHVFMEKAAQENAPIHFAEDEIHTRDLGIASSGWRKVEVADMQNDELLVSHVNVGLLGEYQLKNITGVWKAVQVLQTLGWKITAENLITGIKRVTKLTGLKGRWQVLAEKPLTICDTGHNEGGLRLIVEQLNHLQYHRLHMVVGMVNDKDPEKILSLLPAKATYYFCQADLPRALDAELLVQAAAAYGLHGKVIRNVNEALAEARGQASPEDVIFIGGSTFVVAELDEL
jgi:dihydrofolate synthase/folylpolyglutamate synthase